MNDFPHLAQIALGALKTLKDALQFPYLCLELLGVTFLACQISIKKYYYFKVESGYPL
jgi:hypothetical protein